MRSRHTVSSDAALSPDLPAKYRPFPTALYRLSPIYLASALGYSVTGPASSTQRDAPSMKNKRNPIMAHCHLAKQCAFFVVREEGREMREYFTGLYCCGNFRDCARYRAALDVGQEMVPDDMFPNEDDFLSLFAWPGNRQKTQVNKRSRTGYPDRQHVSPSEKSAAASGHLPPTRQTRSRR